MNGQSYGFETQCAKRQMTLDNGNDTVKFFRESLIGLSTLEGWFNCSYVVQRTIQTFAAPHSLIFIFIEVSCLAVARMISFLNTDRQ
jgi:hypothetical protein